jgi:hypothetical protein
MSNKIKTIILSITAFLGIGGTATLGTIYTTSTPRNLTPTNFATSTVSQWTNDAGYASSVDATYKTAASGTDYSFTFNKTTTSIPIAFTLLKRITLPLSGYYVIGFTVSSTGGTSTINLYNNGYLDKSTTNLTLITSTVALPNVKATYSTSTYVFGAGNVVDIWGSNSASGGLGVLEDLSITYDIIATSTQLYFGEINYEA